MEPLGRLGQVTAIRKEQSRSDTGMRGCTRVCVVPRRYVWLSPTSSGLQKSVCGDSDSPAASSFWEKRLQETTDRKGWIRTDLSKFSTANIISFQFRGKGLLFQGEKTEWLLEGT